VIDEQDVFAEIERNTSETQIKMNVHICKNNTAGLNGTSGIGFFDHMLNSFAIHLGAQLNLEMNGDLKVDCHHTIEDTGIVLGKLLDIIIQKQSPITRYGVAYIPMDESLARTVIDISKRPFLVFDYNPKSPMIGDFDTQMTCEFFRAVAFNMGATLHIALLYGQNDHHSVEAIFKSFAHALKDAIRPINGNVLSAKGII
jgi:imidazoleglycerol-phosphate dehydratase